MEGDGVVFYLSISNKNPTFISLTLSSTSLAVVSPAWRSKVVA